MTGLWRHIGMDKTGMDRELSWSVGLHISVVLLGLFYLPHPKQMIIPDHALPVELVNIDEFTRLTQIPKRPKDAPKPEAKTQTAKLAPTPPPAPAPDVLDADSMPTLEAQKKAKPSDEAFTNLVAAPRPLSRPTPPPSIVSSRRKALLDTSQVRALLDKTPDDAPPVPEPTLQTNAAADADISLSEIDAFRVQMQKCWTVPAGAANADDLAVRVRVMLTRQGEIVHLYLSDKSRISDPHFRAAAESVLRAIRRCQPFQMPPEKYHRWRELELNFDPREMLRG